MNKKSKITLITTISLFIIIFLSFSLYAAVQGEIKDMNFKGADIRDVLRAIAEVAQVNLVTDSSVTGNITIHLRDISFDEALNLITQTTGLAYKWDGNTVVVATPGRIEEVYEKLDTRILEFENKDLSKVKEVVNNIYPEVNIQIIRENTQLLLVGKADLVNQAINLINRVDFPEVKVTKEEEIADEPEIIELIEVKHGNLDEVVSTTKNLFPELNVQTDTNNDQLILKGNEKIIAEAKDLIQRIDIPTAEEIAEAEAAKEAEEAEQQEQIVEEKEITEYVKVENISSEELINKIKSIYPDLKMSYDIISKQLIIRGEEEVIDNAKLLVDRFDTEEKKSTQIVSIDYVEMENVSTILQNNIPEVSISTNTLTREIILSGKEGDVNRAINLVSNIDIPRRQVIIEARVEEISSTASETLGISNPENKLPAIEFTKDPQGQINGITASWPDYLKAIKAQGMSETLANPRLMTLNGETGKMLIGERIPVKGVNAQGQVEISYIEAGITLEFLPWITKEDYIELEVSPKVSSIGEELYEGYPSIRTREITTKLRLRDGQTFAIGGLIQQDMQNSVSKVPILSEIPILGSIFKYKTDNDDKTELVIFITPHIVEDEQREDVVKETSSLNQETTEKSKDTEEEKEAESTEDREATDQDEEESTDADTDQSEQETDTETEVVQKTSDDDSFNELSTEELQGVLNTSRKTRDYDNDIPDSLNVLYTVQKDESIHDIAYKYGITAEKISTLNNDKTQFESGEVITISIPGSHLIRVGEDDSIKSIMDQFEVSLEQILDLNQLKSVDEIRPNMLLIMPNEIR